MRRTRNLNSQSKNKWKKAHKVQGKSRGEMWKGLVAMIACTLSWVVKILPHLKSPHKYTVWEWQKGNMLKESNRRVLQSHPPLLLKHHQRSPHRHTMHTRPHEVAEEEWAVPEVFSQGLRRISPSLQNLLNLAYFTQTEERLPENMESPWATFYPPVPALFTHVG